MEIINEAGDLLNLKENKFIGTLPEMGKAKISFRGKNNILYSEEGVKLGNSLVCFCGDNSLIYFRKTQEPYACDVNVYNNNVVYFGKYNYFNPSAKAKIFASEEKHIFIGDNCLFSHGLFFRNSDGHSIYDLKTRKRINSSKSIFVGDHCWLGQNVTIFKGANIHSGAVVGANTFVSKKLFSNNIYCSNPIKIIKKNILWSKKCVHFWTEKDKQEFLHCNLDEWVFEFDKNEYIPFEKIENILTSLKTAQERLEYLQNFSQNENKNRFVLKKKWFNF